MGRKLGRSSGPCGPRAAARWSVALLGILTSGSGCDLGFCSGDKVARPPLLVPDGEFSNPTATLSLSATNGELSAPPFPHGAWASSETAEREGQGGAVPEIWGPARTPSTQLELSRERGELIRSYRDAAGRSVLEEWSFPAGSPPPEAVPLCPEYEPWPERFALEFEQVTVDGVTSLTAEDELPGEYALAVYAAYSATVSGDATVTFEAFIVDYADGYGWKEQYEP